MALALFDLDNTLIAGDSDHNWGEFLIAQKLVDSEIYKKKNDAFFSSYEAGNLDIFAYLEFSLSPLVGRSPAMLKPLQDEFIKEVIMPLMLPLANQLIDKHKCAGDRLVIITATNSFVAEPIVKLLGINEFLATDPEIKNAVFTGQIVGTPTYQNGKVERLNNWLRENNESLEGSHFYSDSINDLPLLLEVDHPVAVDPDIRLRKIAQEKHWKIISLRN
jgi:HAD superfamily hydrolase (TIGR01490 family)